MEKILLLTSVVLLLILLKREMSRSLNEESFISIINHTFRTPLTSIKWMSDSLNQEISRKEQIEISKNLSLSANRLLDIVDTLTGIKNIHDSSSYELRAVSIREILESSLQKYSTKISEKKIQISLPTLNGLPLLSIDTKKISFVIDVLIENAIWYSKEGGTIAIDCAVVKNELVIQVEDSGIGLSWRDRNNMFSKFYRGKIAKKMNTDGMGLGLYMAKIIVSRHSGKIKAISKGKDKGAIFAIKLPIRKA